MALSEVLRSPLGVDGPPWVQTASRLGDQLIVSHLPLYPLDDDDRDIFPPASRMLPRPFRGSIPAQRRAVSVGKSAY